MSMLEDAFLKYGQGFQDAQPTIQKRSDSWGSEGSTCQPFSDSPRLGFSRSCSADSSPANPPKVSARSLTAPAELQPRHVAVPPSKRERAGFFSFGSPVPVESLLLARRRQSKEGSQTQIPALNVDLWQVPSGSKKIGLAKAATGQHDESLGEALLSCANGLGKLARRVMT
ncbi:unnamed protein product [Polarella glacialis]|uniref:Uncharacterized protein n=1 Tax=Polarella glacialis TaxID=89957 RepID=A0A813LZZ6_POLGL|nr:unnamed protein product [Polarella glacialis]